MAKTKTLRIAVLGAGPIGIEAALYGAALGYDVKVYEHGAVGHAVEMWRHVKMFSPWRMNTTSLGLRLLFEMGQPALELEQCPTGAEFVAKYLLPLSQNPLLAGRLRLGCKVVTIGRAGLLKGDLIGQQARTEHPFRLLLEDSSREEVEYADVVLDCSGTYLCPNPIGDGGIYAPGERWLQERLIRHIPDVLGRDRARFAKRRVLLVGAGMSAATTATALAALCAEEPKSQVTWAIRRPRLEPYAPIDGDPLHERSHLLKSANRVATSGGDPVRYWHGMVVDALLAEGHQIRARLCAAQAPNQGASGQAKIAGTADAPPREELFDEVIGLTGYAPDRTIYEQLQIHECYASFGPMKLAATLVGKGGDCLAQPMPGLETLKNPEPNFYILGSKSYAKNSAFLLEIGHTQVRGVFALIKKDESLDLYASRLTSLE